MRGQTVLFVGGGRRQRRAIERCRELGVRVVAVDRDGRGPGLLVADVAEVVDFTNVGAVADAGRRHSVDGVLTVSEDRAVPVVAAVAERLGLPGIGPEVAHRMTNKIAMRRLLAEEGVAQPHFAAARSLLDARAAAETVGFPAVLKPADSGGQRGVFRLDSTDDLDAHLHAALAESPDEEVILERYHDGLEVNCVVVARDGVASPLTLADRLRAPGAAFGVGLIHVYPASIFSDALEEAERIAVHAVHALGLRDGIAFAQLLVTDDDGVVVIEVAALIPGEATADLVRHAIGVDVVEVALRQALGEPVPDELVRPRFQQALATRFLTADPGPLPSGRVQSVGTLDRVLAAPSVVQAELNLDEGEMIRRVRVADDRCGYVIAIGDTSVTALERAEAAARLVEVTVA